jgi:hypothetical protein
MSQSMGGIIDVLNARKIEIENELKENNTQRLRLRESYIVMDARREVLEVQLKGIDASISELTHASQPREYDASKLAL